MCPTVTVALLARRRVLIRACADLQRRGSPRRPFAGRGCGRRRDTAPTSRRPTGRETKNGGVFTRTSGDEKNEKNKPIGGRVEALLAGYDRPPSLSPRSRNH